MGGASYVVRHGRRVEVVTVNPGVVAPKRQKAFEARWVKLPRRWINGLARSTSVNTYRLAHLILMEAYRDKRGNGRINLSTQVTGIPGSTRRRAARELAQLGLITLEERNGTEVFRARVILS
jgi:hypothetical protein